MFQPVYKTSRSKTSRSRTAFGIFELVFHTTAQHVRQSHRNAIMAIVQGMLQTVIFVAVFYTLFELMGARRAALRGDFVLYLMTGITLFLVHLRAFGAVRGAKGPIDPMMLHTPMNTAVSIMSAALSTLYIQFLSVLCLLAIYHFATGKVVIEQPVPAMGMYLLAWFSGVAMGLCFMVVGIFLPTVTNIGATIYRRMSLITSGKMFVANTLPSAMLVFFDWNPLFHTIDQVRGYTFINYNPHFTSWHFALYVSMVLLVLGMMGEFYGRRWASRSRRAGH